MEQVRHDTAAGESVKRYASPEVKVVFVKTQDILCVSNPERYSTETEEGDSNW